MSTLAQRSSNFYYKGIVKAKVVDAQGRTLHCHQSHNGGTTKFFTDIAQVLAGVGNSATIQPYYFALYGLSSDNVPTSTSWETLCSDSSLAAVSPLLPADSISYIGAGTPTTRLQIKIPFTYITAQHVYIFALFPKSVTGTADPSDALAYYKLESAGTWGAFEIDQTARQNSLAIEWDLTFVDEGSL